MIRSIARSCATATVAVTKFVVKWAAILSTVAIILTALYFIAEPFAAFGKWSEEQKIAHYALFFILAPSVGALANQIKGNLAEQAKRQEPQSLRQAFTQAKDDQVLEIAMGWLAWLPVPVGTLVLGKFFGLF